MKEIPIKQIKVWKEAQARKLDREGISELAKSIKNKGLQNPPMVQKEGKNSYLLMSGQRRLAALKRLHENIHRKNMNVKDMAAACAFLAEQIGKSKAAQSLGLSMSTFKKYHGFAGVPDKLKEIVPKTISRDDATKLYQIISDVSKAIKIAHRISALDSPTKKRYLKVLARNPRSSHKKIMKKTRSLVIQQNVSLKLSKKQARGLGTQSRHKDTEPSALAGKIVSDWLRRKGY